MQPLVYLRKKLSFLKFDFTFSSTRMATDCPIKRENVKMMKTFKLLQIKT